MHMESNLPEACISLFLSGVIGSHLSQPKLNVFKRNISTMQINNQRETLLYLY